MANSSTANFLSKSFSSIGNKFYYSKSNEEKEIPFSCVGPYIYEIKPKAKSSRAENLIVNIPLVIRAQQINQKV